MALLNPLICVKVGAAPAVMNIKLSIIAVESRKPGTGICFSIDAELWESLPTDGKSGDEGTFGRLYGSGL